MDSKLSRFKITVVGYRPTIMRVLVRLDLWIQNVKFLCLFCIHLALKHHTSKLSTYADLNSLQTFGFRGEALSSLCALSNVHITTACSAEVPKGTRLEFEISGKLKGRSVVASQKGTTVVVEKLFGNLPVRRRELEKNVKREYNKVLGVLSAYACISTGVKFSASNHMTKGWVIELGGSTLVQLGEKMLSFSQKEDNRLLHKVQLNHQRKHCERFWG
jgi:DNA mismatch repair ATPase MutL